MMGLLLATIRAKRDELIKRGHIYLYTFEDFDVGASGHPVDTNVYPGYLPAIGGMDYSWHLKFVHRTIASKTSNRNIHGLLLGPVKSKTSLADRRGYEINWPNARSLIVASGGGRYTSCYAQFHAFDCGIGIGVIYGTLKTNGDLTVDVFTVEESYYEAPEHPRSNTETTR